MIKERKQGKLKVLSLINSNDNWEEILSSPPYNIIIKKKNNFVLLKYNQRDAKSDMSNAIVQECRGLILKHNTKTNKYSVASIRFNKFFNYGQEEAVTLEFPCEASEKIDGSLIGVWYDTDTGWHVSTSGNIDAEDAKMIDINTFENYRDIFNVAWDDKYFDRLNKEYTYMFELVSPYTKLVVPYKEIKLYLLAIRNNITLEEVDRKEIPLIAEKLFDGHITSPKSFICNSINQIQDCVNKMTTDDENYEGFVLCDKNFNRIKLKSPAYTNLFFIRGEGVLSDKKILTIILDEQDDDIVGCFPEYTEAFNRMRRLLSIFITNIKNILNENKDKQALSQKEYAEWAKQSKYNDALFKAYKEQYWDKSEEKQGIFIEEYIKNLHLSKLLESIKGEE